MTRCLTDGELILHVDDQLTVDRARAIQPHLADCEHCQSRVESLQRLTRAVAASAVEDDGEAFVTRVSAAMDERPRVGSVWRRYAAAAVVLVAVTPAFWLLLTREGQDQRRDEERGVFTARGEAAGTMTSLVGIEPFVVMNGRHWPIAPAGTPLPPTAGIVFRYTNATDVRVYLLAFGVDRRGEVHWFFPAYLDPRSNPSAVSLPAKMRQQPLAEAVRPEGCPAGPLRVVTVLSRTRRALRQVEGLLQGASSREKVAGRFPGDQVQEWVIDVKAEK